MLDRLRHEIDKCDAILIETLARRLEIASCVATYKQGNGLAIYQPEREADVLSKVIGSLEDKTYYLDIQELYSRIIQLSRRIQLSKLFPYNIVLIGFMGSGKSTVGPHIARISGRSFYDVDICIEEKAGQTIETIFRTKGEAYFRTLERQVIESLKDVCNSVIACGGGAVLDKQNVAFLKEKGKLIWLDVTPETVYTRLGRINNRPLLKDKRIDDIKILIDERNAGYSAIADYKIVTDDKPIAVVTADTLSLITR